MVDRLDRPRRRGRARVRRRLDRRPRPPRDLQRAPHHDRRRVVGHHGLRARRRRGRPVARAVRPPSEPEVARPLRAHPLRVRVVLGRSEPRDRELDGRPVPAGCRCRVDARRLASRVDRLAGIGRRRPTALDGCRRDRRRDRPGRGWSAHAGLRLAGDLLLASAGRGARARGGARGALSQTGSGGSVGYTSGGASGGAPSGPTSRSRSSAPRRSARCSSASSSSSRCGATSRSLARSS